MERARLKGFWGFLFACLSVAAITAAISVVPGADRLTNVSLIYLLGVMATAYWFEAAAALTCALLSALAVDWFFVQPRHAFTVSDPSEWLALIIFLLTATLISRLTDSLRLRARQAQQRELEAAALTRASWTIASQVDHEAALLEVLKQIDAVVPCEGAAIFLDEGGVGWDLAASIGASVSPPDNLQGLLAVSSSRVLFSDSEVGFAFQGQPVGPGDVGTGPGVCFPLKVREELLGILLLRRKPASGKANENWTVVESLSQHAAVILERHRVSQAQAHARALQEADKLKTALLSMVSHDFRSPLAAIKASVTGLLQEGLPWEESARRELLAGIDMETDRLSRMVGDILALSKLDAEAWRPQREPVAVEDLVGMALANLPADQDARIEVTITPGIAELSLDAVQMVQVVHNLIENALKYSPPGSAVQLVAEATSEAGIDFVLLHVRDSGYGLLPGEEKLIFERFYRGTRWQESAVPGSGIGLAIARGLVEAHGGTLVARPRPGGGTCMTVQLPCRPQTPAQPSTTAQPMPAT